MPPPSRRRWPRSSRRSRPRSARCSRPPRSPVSRSSPISRHPSPSSTRRRGSQALDALLELDLVRADAGSAPVRVSPSARAAGGLRVGPGRLETRALTRARRPSWPSGAPRPPSAPTTSSSPPAGRRGGDRADARRRSGRGARAPAAAARWFEAALRLLPRVDATRQVDVRVALASALRSVGELDRCRDDAAGGDRACFRRTRSRGGSS